MKTTLANPVLDFINTLCNFVVLNLVFLISWSAGDYHWHSPFFSILCNAERSPGRIRVPGAYLYKGIPQKLKIRALLLLPSFL